jgi:hypothetical protein
MMPVSVVLSSLESLVGQGGTFYVVARKKQGPEDTPLPPLAGASG